MTNIRNNNYLSLYISSKYHFKFQIKFFQLEIEMRSLKSQALTSINKNFFKKLQFSKFIDEKKFLYSIRQNFL